MSLFFKKLLRKMSMLMCCGLGNASPSNKTEINELLGKGPEWEEEDEIDVPMSPEVDDDILSRRRQYFADLPAMDHATPNEGVNMKDDVDELGSAGVATLDDEKPTLDDPEVALLLRRIDEEIGTDGNDMLGLSDAELDRIEGEILAS